MYTDINRKTYNSNKMLLFYKLEEGYLVIKITANEKEIKRNNQKKILKIYQTTMETRTIIKYL